METASRAKTRNLATRYKLSEISNVTHLFRSTWLICNKFHSSSPINGNICRQCSSLTYS